MVNDYDVIVVGGGVSGCMAALASARNGAKTLLIERYGFLGGALTNAGVGPMMTFHSGKKQVIKGFAQEVIDRLAHCGGTVGHIEDSTGYCATVTPFDPEKLKIVLDEMLSESGCEVLFHSFLYEVKVDNGHISKIGVATKEGPKGYTAGMFVDATGDGDLAAFAGLNYKMGRDEDGLCQPMTTNIRVGNVDTEELINDIRNNPDNYNVKDFESIGRAGRLSFAGLYSQYHKAKEEGRIHSEREDVLMFESVIKGTFVVNTTRVNHLRPMVAKDLSRAEIEGRCQAREIFDFLKSEAPGFTNAVLLSTGPQIGIRESRRICGLYELCADDIVSARKFDDSIACGSYPIDIHSPTGESTKTIRVANNAYYTVPLRALIADGVDNLFMCGRCISASHEAIAAVRVTPISMAMGQAAGVAASECIKAKCNTRNVNYQSVRSVLMNQNALVE